MGPLLGTKLLQQLQSPHAQALGRQQKGYADGELCFQATLALQYGELHAAHGYNFIFFLHLKLLGLLAKNGEYLS